MARYSTACLGFAIAFFLFPSMVLGANIWVGTYNNYWGSFDEDYMVWASTKTFHVGDVLGEY